MLGQTYLYYITSNLNICLIFEFMSSNVLVFCYELIFFLVPLTLCNCCVLVWFMVFNATFNNISVISWWSVLLVEETGVPGENNRPVANHWQTWPHNVVSSTPHHGLESISQYDITLWHLIQIKTIMSVLNVSTI
jgi:hypothetical protein